MVEPFSDGSFYRMGLRPGHYEATIDDASLAGLGFLADTVRFELRPRTVGHRAGTHRLRTAPPPAPPLESHPNPEITHRTSPPPNLAICRRRRRRKASLRVALSEVAMPCIKAGGDRPPDTLRQPTLSKRVV